MKGVRKVFFVGIGGAGMSALAMILDSKGIEVLGSDKNESTKTKELRDKGIKVYIGHSKSYIDKTIDLVVYTNAVGNDTPELSRARELNINCISRAELLAEIEKEYFSIGIAGTHGKTTTTSMVSKLLVDANFDPTIANGGNLAFIGGNYRIGDGKYFVYEACEAFGSFLHFKPNISVVNNIDNDHIAEYYKTMDNLINAFTMYINNTKEDGQVIANGDDPTTSLALEKAKKINIITYGIRDNNTLIADNIKMKGKTTSFEVYNNGKLLTEIEINVPGVHNVYNSLAVVGVGLSLGISPEKISESLKTFRNAERRFEIKFENKNITIIDDYGHHPTEIKATLTAAKNYSKKKVIAIFQPHLWSRTYYLYKDFALALNIADAIIVTEVYGARETRIEEVSGEMIVKYLKDNLGRENSTFFAETEEKLIDTVFRILKEDCVIVVLGAGDINKIIPKLINLLPV